MQNTFNLNFRIHGAAFVERQGDEIARILISIAANFEGEQLTEQSRTIRDINGNTIGTFDLNLPDVLCDD